MRENKHFYLSILYLFFFVKTRKNGGFSETEYDYIVLLAFEGGGVCDIQRGLGKLYLGN